MISLFFWNLLEIPVIKSNPNNPKRSLRRANKQTKGIKSVRFTSHVMSISRSYDEEFKRREIGLFLELAVITYTLLSWRILCLEKANCHYVRNEMGNSRGSLRQRQRCQTNCGSWRHPRLRSLIQRSRQRPKRKPGMGEDCQLLHI